MIHFNWTNEYETLNARFNTHNSLNINFNIIEITCAAYTVLALISVFLFLLCALVVRLTVRFTFSVKFTLFCSVSIILYIYRISDLHSTNNSLSFGLKMVMCQNSYGIQWFRSRTIHSKWFWTEWCTVTKLFLRRKMCQARMQSKSLIKIHNVYIYINNQNEYNLCDESK